MKRILTSLFTLALLYTPATYVNADIVSGIDEEGVDVEKRRGRGGGRYRGGRGRGGGRYRGGRGRGRGRYTFGRHRPYRGFRYGRRFGRGNSFYRWLGHRYIYLNWVRYNYNCYNGYTYYRGVSWYCHDGYLHRYGSYDQCVYHLVNLSTNAVEQTFAEYSCNTGYDLCADQRNIMNQDAGSELYFCSERVR